MMDGNKTDSFSSMGIDALTGLNSRSYLEDVNKAYIGREGLWSLLMLDVDHFKLINDIYGHLTGDKVLRQTALTLQVNLKDSDTAVRFGGDEFIIVMPDTSEEGALDLSQRLIYEINRISFTPALHISISIGVSQSRESDTSIMDLVSRADQALYRAKEEGRGRFFFFTDDLSETETPEISFSHFVGRRTELQKLRQLLEESVTDSSRIAIISGAAGSGKTRLVDELLNYCDFMKSVVVRNSVMEHTHYQPFSLIIEPVRDVLSGLTDREFDIVRAAVEPVHPATLDLFPELRTSVMDDTIYFREERLKFKIFRDISIILEAVSAVHPLTLILDNLQWVTDPDLSILSFVARNTQHANILYMCLLRRNENSENIFRKLISIKTSLPLLSLEIGKMSVEETRNMILFSLKDPNVPAHFQEFMITQSGGNPLFLRELLKSCVDSAYISCTKTGEKKYSIPDDVEIPESIGQIITNKLDRISGDAVELLRIVSISPDQFTIALLEGMTGRDKVAIARRIDECIRAGLLEEINEDGKGVSLRFTHGAVRDYLSSDLPDSLKYTYHQRMAAYFQGFYEEGREDLLTSVAYHYTRSMDDSNAAKYALLSASQAFSRGANRDAIHWYTVYLDRMDEPENTHRMFVIHLNLGSLYCITGEVDKADGYLKEALELTSDSRELAAVHLRLGRNNLNRSLYPETLENYGKAVSLCAESDMGDPLIFRLFIETLIETSFVYRLQRNYNDAFSCLEKAEKMILSHPEEISEDIKALFRTRKADVISEVGSEDEALELYEEALDIYTKIGDIPGKGTVLNNMHAIYSHKGDYDRTRSTLEEAIRINVQLDDRLGIAIGYYNIAEYYQEINMLDLSREHYDMYMELSDVIRNELGFGYGRYGLARLHWLEGEPEKSRFYFENAIEIFEKLRFNEMKKECNLMIAQICVYMGKFDEAERILDSIDKDSMNPSDDLNSIYMRGLLKITHPDSDSMEYQEAVELFRKVIDSANYHSEADIALYYHAMATAYSRLDLTSEMKETLLEGAVKLAGKLGRINTFSIRKSMMKRREIAEFIELCQSNDVPFPPDGITFSTDR